jgi:surfeit locus 1 family protein
MSQSSQSRRWLAPTLTTMAGVALLLGLGTWQIERLHWKEGLIAAREQRLDAAPIDLPSGDNPAAIEYRRVHVTGRFVYDREMYLASRTLNGENGYHIMTPLRPAAGLPVLIDRGWIPLYRKDPASRPESRPEGPSTVDGYVRLPERTNMFTPPNDPVADLWFSIDLAAMARYAGLGAVRPFYIQAAPGADPKSLPIGIKLKVDLPNDHLQYAITWYALAAALLVTYIIYMRRRRSD